MNAYPLFAKLPGDVCQHINKILADSAQRTICKYYRSNPYLKYRTLCLIYKAHPSSQTAHFVRQFCRGISGCLYDDFVNYGVWARRRDLWYLKELEHAIQF